MLVTGRRGLRGAWPLPVFGSLSYILGQFPTSQWLGPYLPDNIGAVVSFGCMLPRFWRLKETLGFGGAPLAAEAGRSSPGTGPRHPERTRPTLPPPPRHLARGRPCAG